MVGAFGRRWTLTPSFIAADVSFEGERYLKSPCPAAGGLRNKFSRTDSVGTIEPDVRSPQTSTMPAAIAWRGETAANRVPSSLETPAVIGNRPNKLRPTASCP